MNNLEKVFTPNLTTKLIIDSVKKYLHSIDNSKENYSYLEMGCGSGEISFELYDFIKDFDITLSDVSPTAIEKTKKRFATLNNNLNFFVSNLYENIPKKKYDIIISDVAAISEDVLPITNWYEGVSCQTGQDVIDLIKVILEQAKDFMKEGSVIIYPALNLSNLNSLREITNKNFKTTEVITSKNWPYNFNDEQKNILRSIKKRGSIDFKELSGAIIFNTEVWISKI